MSERIWASWSMSPKMLKCLIMLVSLMTRSEIVSAYKEKRWALRTKKKKIVWKPLFGK